MDEDARKKPWSVIVVGGWNLAILTPEGISRLLFETTPDNISIEIPLNIIAPNKIMFEKVVVMVTNSRLVIESPENNWASLDKARKIASRALEKLPITPCVAAGLNLTVPISDRESFVNSIWSKTWDAAISTNEKYVVTNWTESRKIKWTHGTISITARYGNVDSQGIGLNFEEQSTTQQDLSTWLKLPLDTFISESDSLIKTLKK